MTKIGDNLYMEQPTNRLALRRAMVVALACYTIAAPIIWTWIASFIEFGWLKDSKGNGSPVNIPCLASMLLSIGFSVTTVVLSFTTWRKFFE